MQAKVAEVLLEDDRLIEISSSGDIGWEWVASDHIDELGFAADARQAIKSAGSFNAARGSFDWLHINSATFVGPNRWFDQGDRRFAPNNVIISSREASLLAIVGRDGSIVWRLGPDFSASKELRAIRQIKRRVPRLPLAVRLDPAAHGPQGAACHSARARRVQGAVGNSTGGTRPDTGLA